MEREQYASLKFKSNQLIWKWFVMSVSHDHAAKKRQLKSQPLLEFLQNGNALYWMNVNKQRKRKDYSGRSYYLCKQPFV